MNKSLRSLALTLVAILGCLASNATTFTVYFDNSSTWWDSVSTWIWDDNGGNHTGGNWPGAAMTETGIEYRESMLLRYSFDADVDASTLSCIFSSGDAQTGDYKLENNAVYKFATQKGAPTIIGKVVDGVFVRDDASLHNYTVYFDNADGWSAIDAYLFVNGQYYIHAWPGFNCEPTAIVANERELWMYVIEDASIAAGNFNIIFNNNGLGKQTPDMTLVDGAVYSGAAGTIIGSVVDGVFVAAGSTNPDTPAEPTAHSFYVVGEQTGWSFNDEYLMEKTGLSDNNEIIYTLSVDEFAGQFKISTSGWNLNFGGDSGDSGFVSDKDHVVLDGSDITKVGVKGGKNFTYTGNNVTFYLYYSETGHSYVRVTSKVTTAVDDLEISAGETGAVYYNLSGVRVDNPHGGMFIRVANGKAEKVVLN